MLKRLNLGELSQIHESLLHRLRSVRHDLEASMDHLTDAEIIRALGEAVTPLLALVSSETDGKEYIALIEGYGELGSTSGSVSELLRWVWRSA